MLPAAMITLVQPCVGPAAIVCSAVVLSIACLNDLACRTLPNWASLALVVIGLALRAADATLLGSLAIAAAVFTIALACWRCGWIGGGDVKLLAACTLLVPPGQVFGLVLATALAGGALAAIYLLLRRFDLGRPRGTILKRPSGVVARVWQIERWRITRKGSLPYGCAIATATMFVLLAPRGLFGP